ncbi:hypothetical protein [Aliiroseovarius crassostreae]|uniref:hypothetical protein n=1 Tax=Aliiroseovarius crassostreae TaxID=154981 RepID=UPI0022003ED9|nr:hypothetical protein [Aliiroseovarius crassostreae]UWP88443.1 hypothetical protein K3J57_11125 [Aliiroseovarius crassostreae]
MTSTQHQQLINNARKFSEKLAAEARSDVSTKILKVDEACRNIMSNGGLVSMKSVRAWLSTNVGLTIAPQTLMNKRQDKLTGEKVHSPFRVIIDKYCEIQSISSSSPFKEKRAQNLGSVVMSEAELASIPDHQVRYKVQLLAGRVRNLETQLNQLRTISKLPTLPRNTLCDEAQRGHEEGVDAVSNSTNQALHEAEIAALAEFLKPNALKRRGLGFDDLGRLNVTHPANRKRKTVPISSPELRTALEKILRFHDA